MMRREFKLRKNLNTYIKKPLIIHLNQLSGWKAFTVCLNMVNLDDMPFQMFLNPLKKERWICVDKALATTWKFESVDSS